ncbi:MAG: regulator, partial [Saprospiraceae bacterium]|nr:regulator [Saprospiraceae bacterium]
WFTVDKNGLLVYDDNGTLNTPNDDNVRLIKTTNSQLPENRVRCIEVDLDGEVWVGTELGVVSFNCGTSAFEPQLCQGFKQIVEVDGFRANLLETEDVRAIAVDGANRKWFGTTNGVFLMSPNGKEQLAFFNSDNSPLPDNFINDIKIHPESGEVFIATGSGLVSYKGEAVQGVPFHVEENAYAFPNPVRPDYFGPIAIKGLTRDADIKITDVTGQLVFQTRALGGQAVWDGNDYTGRRASSGVYYVFATSDDGLNSPNTLIAKLLFIN